VKVGDLVKYKAHPHRSLQHLLGLVTSYDDSERALRNRHGLLRGVYVIWGQDRPQGPSGTLIFEYVDELEVINESR
jgi:hypothetical protein